jgi:adenylylsulfate kinase-like enzyme
MKQRIIWMSGGQGSGKSTLAGLLRGLLSNWIILDENELKNNLLPIDDSKKQAVYLANLASFLRNQGNNVIICSSISLREAQDAIKDMVPDCDWVC